MFKSKVILTGIILALVLGLSIGVPVMANNQNAAMGEDAMSLFPELPDSMPEGVVAYVSTDGGKTIIPVMEELGVAGRLPEGMTKTQFLEKHAMSPEAEAAIVHKVPPCPVIIDGIRYEPEQIHLFDGQRLGFTVGNDGMLYAFTSVSGLEKFQQEQRQDLKESAPNGTRSDYSYFFENKNYDLDGDWIAALPGATLPDLSEIPGDFDDIISSEAINSAADSATLFEDFDYEGDYFDRPGGTSIPNLGSYGWNDEASSLIVWWF